ncbi:ig-like domain-containing protein [Trichonephila clavipes]|nr:ig-like domain-containing protein [Trichonephila clavipes]
MHAVIGTTVSLPCNLSPPSPDDSFSLVLWYRLDLPNPIYTLDARSATAPGDATHFANKRKADKSQWFNPASEGHIGMECPIDLILRCDTRGRQFCYGDANTYLLMCVTEQQSPIGDAQEILDGMQKNWDIILL